jgi:type II secretory pathway pseudopilin PulG
VGIDSPQEKGASLLEVLVAFSILGIALIGVTYFYQNAARSKKYIRIQAVQEALAHDIRSKLQIPSALYASLLDPKNEALIRCVMGVDSGCTEALTSQPHRESDRNLFTLHHSTGPSTSEAISSIYYSYLGKRNCAPSDKSCVFKVDTFFYALCPIGDDPTLGHPSICTTGAQEVRLGYSVSQIKEVAGQPLLSTLPRLMKFYTLSVTDILGSYRNGSCNPGAVPSGYMETGTMNCACKLPYITSSRYAPNRRGPVCAHLSASSLACPAGLLYHGLNESGVPICKTFADSYECKTLSDADFDSSHGSCGEGYWIQRYTRGSCNFYCAVGNGGGACTSWETATSSDTRLSAAYANKTLDTSRWSPRDLASAQRILQPGMQIYSGSAVDTWVKEGMVCEGGTISCCKQK